MWHVRSRLRIDSKWCWSVLNWRPLFWWHCRLQVPCQPSLPSLVRCCYIVLCACLLRVSHYSDPRASPAGMSLTLCQIASCKRIPSGGRPIVKATDFKVGLPRTQMQYAIRPRGGSGFFISKFAILRVPNALPWLNVDLNQTFGAENCCIIVLDGWTGCMKYSSGDSKFAESGRNRTVLLRKMQKKLFKMTPYFDVPL